MTRPNYEVELDLFRGPLDLLLYLVRKEELSIREIPLSRICDQYMEYLDLMKELNLEIAGDFIVMAAILMRLKAHELLPQEVRDKLDKDDDFIDREKLIRQIEEYEQFKNIARSLREKEEENYGVFYRPRSEVLEATLDDFYDQKDVEVYDLILCFRKMLESAKEKPVYFMEADNITIDDRIEKVLSIIGDKKRVPFAALFEDDQRKIVMVVTFMALLELVRMRYISFEQDNWLGDIVVFERENRDELLSSPDSEEKIKPSDEPGFSDNEPQETNP